MLLLHYAGCSTCKKAKAWLKDNAIAVNERAIVEAPPTPAELREWIRYSGLPVRKWLNTSGQSYRALGKERIDAMSDDEIIERLSHDGKLVKRPVLVAGKRVLVGFKPEAYRDLLK